MDTFISIFKLMKKLLINMVIIYQKCISPLFPPTCRYYLTCSKYMITAISKHGCILGIIMGVARIIRCNPFVRGGVDPVPDFFTIRRNPHPEKYMDPIIAKKFYK